MSARASDWAMRHNGCDAPWEKLLLLVLADYHDQETDFFVISFDRLARLCCMKDWELKGSIHSLVSKNIISVVCSDDVLTITANWASELGD